MNNDDATQFSYFRDNELTQLADISGDDESSNSSKALEEGTTFLNKYKILKVLGEGSFSLIYLLEAIDASKKLLVAKEFFPKGFVTRSQNGEVILKTSLSEKEIENYHFMKDIFIGEAQNLVKVSKRAHPNVLNFFALEENINNTMYLITDYEEGITLKDYVKERKRAHKGKLTNEEIKGIATGLLNGLSHIHKVDVYHQDIKLENILIRQDQYPLLLDFGASIILYDEKQKKYFNATTPRYAAPEQVDLAQPPTIDQRTDVYELGVLLYKLITDEFPPKASERLKAEEEHKDSYVSLEMQKPYGYDSNVLKTVDRALELRQDDRFQNADDFKKALLLKKSYANVSIIGLSLLIPFIFGLIYMLWPASEGTAKLNLEQKKYFVYSDGKKITLSEEKTILLSEGKHQLTIIKDGYIPHEVNVTIKANHIVNVYGKLAPISHAVILESNIATALFMVNGKRLTKNTFEGKAGKNYTITTTASNYTSKVKEVNYNTLYKNDFKFFQELKPAQKKVNIVVDTPIKLGINSIRINGKILSGTSMIAQYNESYIIDIENPYYEKIQFKRSYAELNKNPEQSIVLKQGQGEIILKGLPTGVTIDVYKKNTNEDKQIISQFIYANKEYKFKISAYDRIYMKLSKEGYKTVETPIFELKHNAKYMKKYTLIRKVIKKKPIVVKKEVSKPLSMIKPSITPHISGNIKKQNNIKVMVSKKEVDKKSVVIAKKTEEIKTIKNVKVATSNDIVKKPVVIQKKKNINKIVSKIEAKKSIKVRTVKYKIKRGDSLFTIARANHTTIKEVKRQNNLKKGEILRLGRVLDVPVDTYYPKKKYLIPKTKKKKIVEKKKKTAKRVRKKDKKKKRVKAVRKKYNNKKTTASYQWYCIAGAEGSKTWSAKHSTRKGAYSTALRKCRRRRNSFCRVSSCYILGGS